MSVAGTRESFSGRCGNGSCEREDGLGLAENSPNLPFPWLEPVEVEIGPVPNQHRARWSAILEPPLNAVILTDEPVSNVSEKAEYVVCLPISVIPVVFTTVLQFIVEVVVDECFDRCHHIHWYFHCEFVLRGVWVVLIVCHVVILLLVCVLLHSPCVGEETQTKGR